MMKILTSKSKARKNILIGQCEQIMLLAILHRSNRAYGIEILDEVESRTSIKLTVGALYSTLDRMVTKDIIECVSNKDTNNSNSRKYFSVTSKGRQLLYESINITDKTMSSISIDKRMILGIVSVVINGIYKVNILKIICKYNSNYKWLIHKISDIRYCLFPIIC